MKQILINQKPYPISELQIENFQKEDSQTFQAQLSNQSLSGKAVSTAKGTWVFLKGHIYFVEKPKKQRATHEAGFAGNTISAPMPGKVFKLLVKEGDQVEKDQDVLVLEAMKMEHVLTAPCDGEVQKIHIDEGDLVELGLELVEIQDSNTSDV